MQTEPMVLVARPNRTDSKSNRSFWKLDRTDENLERMALVAMQF